MKKYILIMLFLATANSIFSQNWQTNFKEAQQEAQNSKKSIVLVFSGSDWCAPCIKLDAQIFQSDAFKAYADTEVVLVRADFPRRKQNALSETLQNQNRALAEMYNPNGFFPFVLLLDAQGTVLGELGYEKIEPQAYVNKMKAFTN